MLTTTGRIALKVSLRLLPSSLAPIRLAAIIVDEPPSVCGISTWRTSAIPSWILTETTLMPDAVRSAKTKWESSQKYPPATVCADSGGTSRYALRACHRSPDARTPASAQNLHSGLSPVPAPRRETSPHTPGSTLARSSHAAAPSPLRRDTAPRSASLAGSSLPATPSLRTIASCAPSPPHHLYPAQLFLAQSRSPQSESLLAYKEL
jgi:hypothetical protein